MKLTIKFYIQSKIWRFLQHFNGALFPVDIDNVGLGFFAHLNVTIRLLRYAEENGLSPRIRFTSANYSDPRFGRDWLPYHFVLKHPAPDKERAPFFRFVIRTHRDLGLSRPDDLSLEKSRDLLFRYMEPKSEIASHVHHFCQINAINENTIAVHYRGTDKSMEAPRVNYENAFSALEKYLSICPGFTKVFVASDEERFIHAIRERFNKLVIISLDDHRRSIDGKPVHLSNFQEGNFEMGRDAITNALIMARCSTIIRTPSLLSSWVSILNPTIKVILLSKSYTHSSWFPERIVEKNAFFWNPESGDFNSAASGRI